MYSLFLGNNLISMSHYLQDTLLNERKCKTMISMLPFVLFLKSMYVVYARLCLEGNRKTVVISLKENQGPEVEVFYTSRYTLS